VKNIPNVRLYTPIKPGFGCAIGLVGVEGKPPKEMDAFFFNKYRIHTTPIEWENLKGVRITPNVYTTTRELDTLVEAITNFAKA
jgi:selenocysteine lyase/cysteine desulfurase